MPGVVVEVRTPEEGKPVQKGDPLVVLSAMKMETVVSAPCSGSLTEVNVAVGDHVDAGDLIAEIDTDE